MLRRGGRIALLMVLLAPAASLAGCYCSHGRTDPIDAASPVADAGPDAAPPLVIEDAGQDAAALACDDDVDALAEAARLEALAGEVGFGPDAALPESAPATVMAVSGPQLELALDSGELVTFRWPDEEPAPRWFHEMEAVQIGIRDGWHYVDRVSFGSFVYVRAFDADGVPGAVPEPIDDLPMVFAPLCARPIPDCAGGETARQFLLGVGREAFRRWVPSGAHDYAGPAVSDVWHVGSIEAPLACGEPPRFRAVIAVNGETICIC